MLVLPYYNFLNHSRFLEFNYDFFIAKFINILIIAKIYHLYSVLFKIYKFITVEQFKYFSTLLTL